MSPVDPATLNALLTEVTSAARAAADAATRTQQETSQGVDWSKLLSKLSKSDRRSQQEEINHFKDWSWQVVQYLPAINQGYNKVLEDLATSPTKAMDMSSASQATRERNNRMYGLLARLLRGGALHTLKAVGNSDGREAWRQLLLLLTLRRTSKGRGLALMAATISWPQFDMRQPVQPQLLKFEDSVLEAERAGVEAPEEMNVAEVCVSLANFAPTSTCGPRRVSSMIF